MTKFEKMAQIDQTLNKNGYELIVYQIGELKAMFIEFKNAQAKLDVRVSALEIWQAGEMQRAKGEDKAETVLGKFDITKVMLAIIALAASAIALALAAVQGGVVH